MQLKIAFDEIKGLITKLNSIVNLIVKVSNKAI